MCCASHELPRQPKLPGHRPPALSLDKDRPPHPRIDLHGVHTSGVPRRKAPPQAANLVRYAETLVGGSSQGNGVDGLDIEATSALVVAGTYSVSGFGVFGSMSTTAPA